MQLMSINTARAIWVLNTRDLNPRGRNIDSIIEWLRLKYKFEKYPSSPFLEDQSKGWVFTSGAFSRKDKDGKDSNIYIDFTVFTEGLVATTRSSTDDSEDFL